MAKQESEDKKIFRQSFYKRLSDSSKTDLANETGISRETLYSWQTPGRGLPDVYDVMELAKAKKCAPGWLAFGDGKRDPAVNELADAIADELSRIPPGKRAAFMSALTTLAGFPFEPPAASQPATPSEYQLAPRLAAEAQQVQAQLMECAATVPVGSRLDRALESAEEFLNRLIAAQQPKSPQDSHKDSGASGSGDALSGVKSQRDRKKGRRFS